MAALGFFHLEIAVRPQHWLERALDSNARERVGPHLSRCLALIVGLATLCSMPAMGHPPSLQDCFEGGDFIANAAHARENGMPKSVFIDRLVADVYAIQAFPRQLRWFVADPEDAEFLLAEASNVFDRPLPPEAHRADFLSRCFDR